MNKYMVIAFSICCFTVPMENDFQLPEDQYDEMTFVEHDRRARRNSISRLLSKTYKQVSNVTVQVIDTSKWITDKIVYLLQKYGFAHVSARYQSTIEQSQRPDGEWLLVERNDE